MHGTSSRRIDLHDIEALKHNIWEKVRHTRTYVPACLYDSSSITSCSGLSMLSLVRMAR